MTEGITIQRALLFTDGGSRGNPGLSGIGFTIKVDKGFASETVCCGGAFIGIATNNVAEYRALIWGLQNAHALKVRKLEVHADSELLVKQLTDEYRVKNEGIKPLFREARQLLEGFESFSVKHVAREENSEADRLANEAMDTQETTGNYLVAYQVSDLFSEPEASGPKEVDSIKPKVSGVYSLTVKEHFDAAHALIGYPGQCKDLHGHTWDIEVTIKGTELDEVGIVYDFKDLKDDLKRILDQYDHVYLNDVEPFDTINATAENLARVIFEQMEEQLPPDITLVEVAVWESPLAKLSYSK